MGGQPSATAHCRPRQAQTVPPPFPFPLQRAPPPTPILHWSNVKVGRGAPSVPLSPEPPHLPPFSGRRWDDDADSPGAQQVPVASGFERGPPACIISLCAPSSSGQGSTCPRPGDKGPGLTSAGPRGQPRSGREKPLLPRTSTPTFHLNAPRAHARWDHGMTPHLISLLFSCNELLSPFFIPPSGPCRLAIMTSQYLLVSFGTFAFEVKALSFFGPPLIAAVVNVAGWDPV